MNIIFRGAVPNVAFFLEDNESKSMELRKNVEFDYLFLTMRGDKSRQTCSREAKLQGDDH